MRRIQLNEVQAQSVQGASGILTVGVGVGLWLGLGEGVTAAGLLWLADYLLARYVRPTG